MGGKLSQAEILRRYTERPKGHGCRDKAVEDLAAECGTGFFTMCDILCKSGISFRDTPERYRNTHVSDRRALIQKEQQEYGRTGADILTQSDPTELILYMDPAQILFDFKNAKSRPMMLAALAEQNLCGKTDIARWLYAHGVPAEDIPGGV